MDSDAILRSADFGRRPGREFQRDGDFSLGPW